MKKNKREGERERKRRIIEGERDRERLGINDEDFIQVPPKVLLSIWLVL